MPSQQPEGKSWLTGDARLRDNQADMPVELQERHSLHRYYSCGGGSVPHSRSSIRISIHTHR